MKNILLVGSGSYADKRIKEEAKALGINIVPDYMLDSGVDYIATLNRRYNKSIISLQRGKQVNRVIDSIFWKDKITQLTTLDTGCRKPKFLIGKGLDYQLIINTLDSPFIAKRSNGSRGSSVFLIKDYNDFKEAVDCDVFEEVIWDSLGKDVRVYSIRGEVKCCMLRQNENSFKSNFHQGGVGSKYDIDEDIRSIAKTIFKATNLDVIGIDLLLGRDGYVFCELNANPGFEELERACEYNAAKELIELCVE